MTDLNKWHPITEWVLDLSPKIVDMSEQRLEDMIRRIIREELILFKNNP